MYFYKEYGDVISKSSNKISKIPINNLIRYELKTESEIQKDVTLTRLLALGIFAFGAKKKLTILILYYLTLKMMYKLIVYSKIFITTNN